MKYPPSLVGLIRELSRLPGIGPKSAQRLAFYLFEQPREDIERLAGAILEAKRDLHTCPVCFNITDAERCDVCSDPTRDQDVICVVEEPGDVIAIERSGEYRGLYHVLHGVLSPMNGVGPERLHIKPLLPRVQDGMEVILATGTTVEGDATALYLQRLLEPLGAVVSRIAYGLPVGGALEYADEVTLGRAMSGRRRVNEAPTPPRPRRDDEDGTAPVPSPR
ncbi:recombination protein RecR [Deinococcus metallilatus]|uniref:Recombination protein RecR n=1 Tax=Deinococcus metallilatus TaxID=1211322 RepID=A0AAJ5F2J8_9DEIO|nr:recombination mediator RecR [Deinococcus metallilatus]MBB5296656.1 recombination protein RecR [Deinococcus metallilatus]QBY09257.1 recombination protein RecR [Deinococcus metallilatus]RXJ09778.1 recombination protein RecR [Deinococcus metallilatus]TLK24243.1 recombination protein RecR [Deinococcus metallilatus]GMA13686.1 recombination protein RecR [Deinococcus metallilatus]